MHFKQFSNINKLMVLGSTVCNLNCSFCYLHDQHESNAYVLLNKEIQKAWKNGTYVANIKKVFEAIECKPDKVKSLEFWGGEPLIITNNLIQPMYELITYLPNVNSINIPTNFSRINDLAQLVNAVEQGLIDKKWDVHTQNKLQMHIQLSLDAPPGEMQKYGHILNWDTCRKNVDSFCYELSQLPEFTHVEVDFEIHSTLPWEIIRDKLKTAEDIQTYLNYFYDFHLYIQDIIKKYHLENRVIQAVHTTYPHTAQPYSMSIEEALEATQNLYFLNYIQHNLNFSITDGRHIYEDNGFNTGGSPVINSNPVCMESGLMGLTILYDGTICECPCDYILTTPSYWHWVKNNSDKQHEYRDSLLKKQFYINPLTATEEEKDYFDWYIYDGIRLNQSTAMHMTINLCLEMALSRQIDYTYFVNPEELLKSLYQFNNDYSCPREQIPTIHNVYMMHPDYCRRWLNGITRMAQRDTLADINYEAKELFEWNSAALEDDE